MALRGVWLQRDIEAQKRRAEAQRLGSRIVDLLSGPCAYVVAFLAFDARFALKFTCRRLHGVLSARTLPGGLCNDFRKEVERRLSQRYFLRHPSHASRFLDILREERGDIFGSTMLDILTHGQWKFTDLDVLALCPGKASRYYSDTARIALKRAELAALEQSQELGVAQRRIDLELELARIQRRAERSRQQKPREAKQPQETKKNPDAEYEQTVEEEMDREAEAVWENEARRCAEHHHEQRFVELGDPLCADLCHVRQRVLELLREVPNELVTGETRAREAAQCVPGHVGESQERKHTLDYKGHQIICYSMFPAHNTKAKCQDANDFGRCLHTGPRWQMSSAEKEAAAKTWTWQPVVDFSTAFGYASTLAYADATIDFDFTAVLYNGRRLRVLNWESIWTRSCTFCHSDVQYRSGNTRGSNTWSAGTGRLGDVHTPMSMTDRAILRQTKYRARGFSVGIIWPGEDDDDAEEEEDDERDHEYDEHDLEWEDFPR